MTEAFSLTCWDGGKGPGTFIGTVSKNKWSKSQKLGLLILCRDRFIIIYIYYIHQFSRYSDGLGTFTSISIPPTIPTCGAHWNGRGSQEGRERKSRKSQPSSGSVPGQPGQPFGTIAMFVITRGLLVPIKIPFTRPGKQRVCDMEKWPSRIREFSH